MPLLALMPMLMLGLVLLLVAVPAQAQQVEPTEAQVELVEKGVAAGLQNQHAEAVDYFRAALELGELNIAWLNLGRALSRLGRCEEARTAYQRALLAPAVASPPPSEVHAIIKRYEQELSASCTGTLALRCEPADLMVSIDAAAPAACPRGGVTLAWGSHTLMWNSPSGPRTTEVAIEPGHTAEVTLGEGGPQAPPASAAWVAPVGWTSLGLGAALLVAGASVDLVLAGDTIDALEGALDADRPERARELADQLETEQQLAVGLYIGGAALAAGGLGLLLAHYLGGAAASDEGVAAGAALPTAWFPGGSGGGVHWTVRW